MSGLRLEHHHDMSQISKSLGRLALMDTSKADDEVGSYFVSRIVERLEDQETFEGEDFIQSQAAIERQGKTLMEHGHLRDSYTSQIVAQGVAVGSDLDYAAIHHFGGTAGRNHTVKINANPVLGLNAQDDTEITQIYLKHISRVARS